MQTFVKDIIAKKTPCYFISPHLDDAALSCGGLIAYLSDKTNVGIITVFTNADTAKPTLSAKKALANSAFSTASDYYAARIQEDKNAFSFLPVTLLHLGEVEALWRKKTQQSRLRKWIGRWLPEVTYRYPTYKFHITSGKISPDDKELVRRITRRLKRSIPAGAILFAPIGVGNHVDHLIVKEAVSALGDPVYWVDQPYVSRQTITAQKLALGKKVQEVSYNQKLKQRMIQAYRSQLSLLYPTITQPKIREFFILPK